MAEAILSLKNVYVRNRSGFLLTLKILIAAGLLIFIVKEVNIRVIISGIMGSDLMLLSLAFGLSFVNMSLQYLKWKLVCNSLLQENDRQKIVKSLFYGFSGGSFTPARAGEYIGRALAFPEKPISYISSAVLIDKLFSLFIVVLLGLLSFMLYFNFSFIYSAGITLLCIVLLYTGYCSVRKIIQITEFKWLQRVRERLIFIKKINAGFSIKLTLLSLLFYSCFILQFAILISAFSHHYDFINYIWTGNLVMFAKTIVPSISFGELGIREGASVYFLTRLGEKAAVGFNASVFLFLINIVFPAMLGLIFLLKRK